jgi:hypothetical protein
LIALLAACDTASDPAGPTEDPSTISLEAIQTVGDLSGGVFDGPFTLTRTLREYTPDGEDNVTGMLYELDDAELVTDIYGIARDEHPVINQFHIRIPATTTGTYEYDSDTDTPEDLWLKLETNYGVWLTAGYDWPADSELSVTITELSDSWIVGTFTADLIYFDVEEIDGGISRTIDAEISYTNLPVLNGSFRVYRDRTNGL